MLKPGLNLLSLSLFFSVKQLILLKMENTSYSIYCYVLFQVYMYSVWNGYLLSLILFVAIWKLFMNYLHAK